MNEPKLNIDLNPHDLAEVQAILKQHIPNIEVWAFGSRVKWTAKSASDLDLALITNEPLSIEKFADIKYAFDESDLPMRVDIVDWATTSESFRKIIEEDKVVVQKGMAWGMSSDWVAYQIEDIASEMGDAPFGSNLKNHDYTDTGALVVQGKNIQGRRSDWSDRRYVNIDKYHKLSRNQCKEGDLLFPKVGTIGKIGLLTPAEGVKYYVLSTNTMRLRVNDKIACRDFVYYYFTWPRTCAYINALNANSVQPVFNFTSLKKFHITLPPLEEQKRISNFLIALDDRIALLRETNTTLESIAQALFKSWFVDFDPVHANAGTQTPSLPPEIQSLFPSTFVESSLGLVPEGWAYLPFTDTVSVIGGGTPKTSIPEYWDGEIPWFSVVDAPLITDVFVIDTTKHISEEGLNKSSTKLLPVGTTIISARGTVGRLALVGRPMAMNQSCYGLRGKSNDSYFTYLSTYRLVESLKQRSHGSVFDTITTETMKGVFVVYPTTELINEFELLVSPVMARIKTNLEKVHSLSSLRDTLLPRLISGQLRLPEVEEQFEAVLG